MDIKTLIRRLETAQATDPKDGFTMEILYRSHAKEKMREVVTEWAAEQIEGKDDVEQAKRIAELEAKVLVYEKIISNSNFAPVLTPPPLQGLEPVFREPCFKPPYEVTCENRTDAPYKIFDGEKVYTCENGQLTPCEPICEEGE